MVLEGCRISVYGSPVPVELMPDGKVICTRPIILDVSKFSDALEKFYEVHKDAFGDCTFSFGYKNWLEGEDLEAALATPNSLESKGKCRAAVLAKYGKDAVKGSKASGSKSAQF
jgi:hypothetical protein